MSIVASIVVASYKRPALLKRCLGALVLQTVDPASYEIIVADNADSEETRRVVELWAERVTVPVRYLKAHRGRGPAVARNEGWRAARGEIIAFTDDDCLPSRRWLESGLAACSEEVAGAWGKLVMPLPARPTDYERDAARLEKAQFVTANCFCRRSALASVGGFDERFTEAWREDSDLFFSLLEREGLFVYAPEALVVHPVRPAGWGVSLKQQRKNMFNALLYKKHPRLYRERIQADPPWNYYLSVSSLLAAAAGEAGGLHVVSHVAFTAWLVLAARFCMQRLQDTSRAPAHVAEMAVTSLLIPPLAVFWRILGALKYRVLFL
jgi:glycosyltransferase involved in cell wall biosynthesis